MHRKVHFSTYITQKMIILCKMNSNRSVLPTICNNKKLSIEGSAKKKPTHRPHTIRRRLVEKLFLKQIELSNKKHFQTYESQKNRNNLYRN